MKDSDDGYELMKQIFAESGIAYEEGVSADEVGFYAAKTVLKSDFLTTFLKVSILKGVTSMSNGGVSIF